MASPQQPRKRQRTTRASRRAATFELLGDGTARASLSAEDARKCSVLANASGEYRCAGQSQASLDAVKRFLAACDEDGEVSSSPLSRADADVCLRCCEAGAALELPSLVKLGVARLRALRGATSPPTGPLSKKPRVPGPASLDVAEPVAVCVKINQRVGCRRRIDGVECAVKF